MSEGTSRRLHRGLTSYTLVIGARVLALAVSAVIGMGGLAAAHQAKNRKPAASSPAAFSPAVATGAFGLDLMRTHGSGNVILSPDSIAAALAMTGTGAAADTATEIIRTLHLKSSGELAAVGDLQGAITAGQAAAAAGDSEPPTLEIANGLFLQQGLPFEPSFLIGAQDHFGAAPEAVDFAGNPSGSLETINGWINERTKGLVPQILDSLPDETVLALANAIYLDADWRHPFEKSNTKPGLFHKATGATRIDFMHQTESLPYGSGRGYRAVALPYRSSTLSLMIVSPTGQRVGSLQHRLDGKGLAQMARGLSTTPVILSLPRFHLDAEAELKPALEKLGMPTSFGEGADFSRITRAVPLKIALVKHVADFTVDEKGTVAAAATVVGVSPRSKELPPREAVTFNANHPFLFFLRDDRTGAVLFAGRLVDPAAAGT